MKDLSTSTRNIVYIGMFAVVLAVCSWISIQTTVPFTMQTFGVFLTIGLLGGKRGTLSILVYITLAAVGVPVLSGFRGGMGVLFGSTGGYILGFLLSALLMWGMELLFKKSLISTAVGMIFGLAVCYFFGTVWFITVYTHAQGPISIMTALMWCVIPYIIPDLIKIGLALWLTVRLKRYVK